jgi:hypothetical protein
VCFAPCARELNFASLSKFSDQKQHHNAQESNKDDGAKIERQRAAAREKRRAAADAALAKLEAMGGACVL